MKPHILGALCAFTALAWSGVARPEARPHLISGPTADYLARYYPDMALRLGVKGFAHVHCIADDRGQLSNCDVVHEWPQNFGFGKALMVAAKLFHGSGKGDIDLSVHFDVPKDGYDIFASPPNPDPSKPKHGRWLRWATYASDQQIAAAYPKFLSTVGYVGLDCSIAIDGHLSGCTPRPKTAAEPQFVQAALSLAPQYLILPSDSDMIGSQIILWLTFIPPDPTPGPQAEPRAGLGIYDNSDAERR